jgi:hypothetical protein
VLATSVLKTEAYVLRKPLYRLIRPYGLTIHRTEVGTSTAVIPLTFPIAIIDKQPQAKAKLEQLCLSKMANPYSHGTRCSSSVIQTQSLVSVPTQLNSGNIQFTELSDTAQNAICLSKSSWQILTLLCFCSSASSFTNILHTPSSCQDLQLRVSYLFLCRCSLLCYAPDSQPTIFTHNLTNFCNVFLQFCPLLAILISLPQQYFLFPQKNVPSTCKLLLSS